MTRRQRWGLGVSTGGLIVVAVFLFTTWPRDILGAPLTLDTAVHQSDVIIILGGGTRKKDTNALPPQAEQRLAGGAQLYIDGVAKKVIVAGGQSPTTGLVEADLMRQQIISDGVLPDDIIQERSSRDTWENATNSLAIMSAHDWKTALVVTSPYHTRRACHFFRKQGADVRCIAAPFNLVPATSVYEKLMDNRAVVREYGAWVYAWFQGRL